MAKSKKGLSQSSPKAETKAPAKKTALKKGTNNITAKKSRKISARKSARKSTVKATVKDAVKKTVSSKKATSKIKPKSSKSVSKATVGESSVKAVKSLSKKSTEVAEITEAKVYKIIPNVRTVSPNIKEKNSTFLCPANTVMTGRYHPGDENGNTTYQYATFKAIDSNGTLVSGTIAITDREWSEYHEESDSAGFFHAPTGRVITGRQHSGDENGNTRYQTGVVTFNGTPTTIATLNTSLIPNITIKESGGTYFRSASRFIIIGRIHVGDENGNSTYYQDYIHG